MNLQVMSDHEKRTWATRLEFHNKKQEYAYYKTKKWSNKPGSSLLPNLQKKMWGDMPLFCPRGIFIWDLMELPSRVWSAETLHLGMSLVEEGAGMDGLDDRSDAELQAQLRQLEDGWVNEKCKVSYFQR